LVEIHNRIVWPQPFFDFLARDDLALTFQEHAQDLEDLFPQKNSAVEIWRLRWSQFAGSEVKFKSSEPDTG
jgi:hypothetical protein